MRAGVVVTAQPGVEDLAVLAEKLGLHSFWVNDTPMVQGDPFVALALCAKATSRIRLGTTATAPDRYTKLYPGYLERIAPRDRDLVLPSLMNTLALVGTRDDLRARVATLGQAGIDELLIQPVVDPPAEMARLAEFLA